jgi:hypothetical protein
VDEPAAEAHLRASLLLERAEQQLGDRAAGESSRVRVRRLDRRGAVARSQVIDLPAGAGRTAAMSRYDQVLADYLAGLGRGESVESSFETSLPLRSSKPSETYNFGPERGRVRSAVTFRFQHPEADELEGQGGPARSPRHNPHTRSVLVQSGRPAGSQVAWDGEHPVQVTEHDPKLGQDEVRIRSIQRGRVAYHRSGEQRYRVRSVEDIEVTVKVPRGWWRKDGDTANRRPARPDASQAGKGTWWRKDDAGARRRGDAARSATPRAEARKPGRWRTVRGRR